jgi:hypothetical protein
VQRREAHGMGQVEDRCAIVNMATGMVGVEGGGVLTRAVAMPGPDRTELIQLP